MKKAVSLLITLIMLLSVAAIPVYAEEEESFGSPKGLCFDSDGNLLVADAWNNVVWKVEDGKKEILAGRIGVRNIYGEPSSGYEDGTALTASFSSPWAIVPFLDGYAVSDPENNVIRFIGDGAVLTAAGSGAKGSNDAKGVAASFNNPTGLAVDNEGNLYVADTGNHLIRKLDKDGKVTTYAGSSKGYYDGSLGIARFSEPTGILWHDGSLYVCDSGNHCIRKITGRKVTTVAGGSNALYEDTTMLAGDYNDGSIKEALFDSPQGMVINSEGDIFVADTGNSAVRKITGNRVTTVIKADTMYDTYPISPVGLALLDDDVYVSDSFSGKVFALSGLENKANDQEAINQDTGFKFSDVSEESWYYNAVNFVYENGLMTGVSQYSFAPEESTTRGMLVTVLWRLEGEPSASLDSSFTDLEDGAYYTKAASWAAENNIVSGYGDGRFGPMDELTREQMATMLYNYVEYKGDGFTGEWMFLLDFTDREDISDWAYEAIAWCNINGVLSGMDEDTLAPKTGATRGQFASILERFSDNI